MGAFDRIKQGREQEYELERTQAIDECADLLSGLLLKYNEAGTYYEDQFTGCAERWNIKTFTQYAKLALRTAHKAYGAPMALAKDNLRQYMVTYFNPTQRTLNVKPLGVLDDDKKPVENLPSGGWIRIPEGYTKGGRYSTIATVAPQLLPMPVQRHDELSDNNPLSYVEWITFQPNRPSPCCGKQVLWSDTGHTLQCEKCKNVIDLSPKV